MVNCAVAAHQPGAVDAKDHRQALKRHFLKNLIQRPLQERGVNGTDRLHSCLGHAGRHIDGASLGDSNIKNLIGQCFFHLRQAGTVHHAGRKSKNAWIGLGPSREGVGESGGPTLSRPANDLGFALAVDRERFRAVELARIGAGPFRAFALLRVYVQQHGVVDVLQKGQQLNQVCEIVAVGGADIYEPELLKNLVR